MRSIMAWLRSPRWCPEEGQEGSEFRIFHHNWIEFGVTDEASGAVS